MRKLGNSPRHRRASPLVRALLRRWLPIAGVVVVVVVGVFLASDEVSDRYEVAFDEQVVESGIQVENILVRGRTIVDRDALLSALGMQIGDPMLELDLPAARDRILSIEWIEDATIERRYPSSVVVSLVERTPLVLWQHEGNYYVVDNHGEVVHSADPGDYADLFLVVGENAPAAAVEFMAARATVSPFRREITAAIRIGNRRWNLRLAGRLDVKLPEHDFVGAWQSLVDLDRRQLILDRDIELIDLRDPDRLILRLSPDAHARREFALTEGKDT